MFPECSQMKKEVTEGNQSALQVRASNLLAGNVVGNVEQRMRKVSRNKSAARNHQRLKRNSTWPPLGYCVPQNQDPLHPRESPSKNKCRLSRRLSSGPDLKTLDKVSKSPMYLNASQLSGRDGQVTGRTGPGLRAERNSEIGRESRPITIVLLLLGFLSACRN